MPNPLREWFRRFQDRLRKWAVITVTLRDFTVDVENYRRDIRTDEVVNRLNEALGLIEQYYPRCLRRLRHDVSRFWVVRYPTRGAFFPGQRVCMIELTFLARPEFSVAEIAACIVHEGAHARLHASGLDLEALARGREEMFCRRRELDFASRLPTELAAPVVARASGVLAGSPENAAPEIDWAEALRRQREVDAQTAPMSDSARRRHMAQIAKERARDHGAG